MFESLSDRLQQTMKKVRGQGKLTEQNMNEMLREIRLALLEADVNFNVVREFINNVKEKAIGQDVYKVLTPGQMLVKIVQEELVELLGKEASLIEFAPKTVIMLVGLQGAGKTTSIAKIAKRFKDRENRKPLLVACDIYRPAAIEQLKVLGEQIGIEVFSLGVDVNPVEIAKQALEYANNNNYDTILFDTAGRLHIDETLMNELVSLKELLNPTDILLTVDALTGQDIINVATSFNEQLGITGAILTKLDGDARGGGALSIRHVTGVPIKFITTGEKLDAIDLFYPDRMADRILGMGDVLSLIDKVQDSIDEELAEKSMEKMMSGKFDLNDMLDQMRQVKKMGSISGLLKMLPGVDSSMLKQVNDEENTKTIKKTEAIILSMTKEERVNPDIIRTHRKNRIAKGSGTTTTDVNRLLKQYETTKKMMKQLSSMGGLGSMANMMGGNKLTQMRANNMQRKMKKKR